ncbi:MAG: hypothetical protein DMG11_23315 [Acidobacteria bacterium]|nr:MAG: hypothetical protein DMG11_23315 [Acidobacteriota bacterium]
MLFLLLLALFLSGCTGQTSADPGIVTVALDQVPENLDPRIAQNATSQRIDELIFNSLVRKNERSEVVPDLALRWETPDPKTYVFHLRDDAKFHDGRPVTSRDVQFTFRTMLDGTVRTTKSGHPYNLIQSIEAPDPYTVVFKLKEVFSPFLWNLTLPVLGIIPDGSPTDFNRHPVGSGPFEFVHYILDDEVLLKRNENYFGDKAGVSMLRFKLIPEAIVRALELRKGTIDIALNVLTPDMVEVLKHDPGLKVMQAEGTSYQYLAFNLTDPVFRHQISVARSGEARVRGDPSEQLGARVECKNLSLRSGACAAIIEGSGPGESRVHVSDFDGRHRKVDGHRPSAGAERDWRNDGNPVQRVCHVLCRHYCG